MFSRKANKVKLIIGEGSKITGDVEAAGAIIIDGTIIGQITAEKAVVGEKAYVRGDIAAGAIIIEGKIDGSLRGKDRVELGATAHVVGDIYTSRLSVMEGAVFHGSSYMVLTDYLEQDDKKPLGQTEDSKIVELFVKEKSG